MRLRFAEMGGIFITSFSSASPLSSASQVRQSERWSCMCVSPSDAGGLGRMRRRGLLRLARKPLVRNDCRSLLRGRSEGGCGCECELCAARIPIRARVNSCCAVKRGSVKAVIYFALGKALNYIRGKQELLTFLYAVGHVATALPPSCRQGVRNCLSFVEVCGP